MQSPVAESGVKENGKETPSKVQKAGIGARLLLVEDNEINMKVRFG